MFVILAASAALTGNVLPIVMNGSTTDRGMLWAGFALIAALPAVAALLSASPALISALAGGIANLKTRRFAGRVAAATVSIWMLLPTLSNTQSVLGPSTEAKPQVQLSAIAEPSSTTGPEMSGTEISTALASAVSPISLKTTERPAMTRRTSGASSLE
jgi:hypothetical protein